MTACVYPAHTDHDRVQQPHPAHIGYLCRVAYRRLEQRLAELPALTSWLHANLSASSSAAPDLMRVTSSDDFPVPVAVDIHDHIENIREVLRSWTQLVAEERNLHGPTNTRVNTTGAFLLTHLAWAAEQLWIDDLCREVNDLWQDAHRIAPSNPSTHRLDLPCPDCQTTTIVRTDGTEHVQCESCGRLWKETEYQWLCRRVAREQEDASGWLLPEVVAAVVHANPKTLRTWVRRGVVASVCNVLPGRIRDERVRVHPLEVAVLVAWDQALAEQAERDAGHADEQRTA